MKRYRYGAVVPGRIGMRHMGGMRHIGGMHRPHHMGGAIPPRHWSGSVSPHRGGGHAHDAQEALIGFFRDALRDGGPQARRFAFQRCAFSTAAAA